MKIIKCLLIILTIMIISINGLAVSKCKEPNRFRLDQIYLEGIQENRELIYSGIGHYPTIQKLYSHLIVNASEWSHDPHRLYDGQQACVRSNTTAWDRDEHEHSTCPYHFVLFTRNDRYPYESQHAVCNPCRSCIHMNSSLENPRCAPDYILRPVLVRSAVCGAHGHWNWMFKFERVPVMCSCKSFVVYNGGKLASH